RTWVNYRGLTRRRSTPTQTEAAQPAPATVRASADPGRSARASRVRPDLSVPASIAAAAARPPSDSTFNPSPWCHPRTSHALYRKCALLKFRDRKIQSLVGEILAGKNRPLDRIRVVGVARVLHNREGEFEIGR